MAETNGWNPNFHELSFATGTHVLTGGTQTGSTNIVTEVGSLPPGSVYFSSNGSGEIWIMGNEGVFFQVTVP